MKKSDFRLRKKHESLRELRGSVPTVGDIFSGNISFVFVLISDCLKEIEWKLFGSLWVLRKIQDLERLLAKTRLETLQQPKFVV